MVQKKISNKKRAKKAEKIAGREEVLEFLTRLLRGEIKQSNLNKDGSLSEVEPGLKERLKAAELLGKGCGAFEGEELNPEDLTLELKILE